MSLDSKGTGLGSRNSSLIPKVKDPHKNPRLPSRRERRGLHRYLQTEGSEGWSDQINGLSS